MTKTTCNYKCCLFKPLAPRGHIHLKNDIIINITKKE